MSDNRDVLPIGEILKTSQEIIIAIPSEPSLDQVAAGLGLYLSLKNVGKSITIFCPSPMVVEYSRLVGLDKVKTSIGNKNLVVSFDYIQDSIEKVSYNVEGAKFNLVVQPKKGSKPLDAKSVSYSYSGLEADLIFTIGATSFESLGDMYTKNQAAFENAYTANITMTVDSHFAKTTITDKNAAALSQITGWFLEQIGFPASGDAASNLLAGIDHATNRFANPQTPAGAFVMAGNLMQNGAKRGLEMIRPIVPNIPTSLLRPMSVSQSEDIEPTIDQLELTPKTTAVQTPPKDWLEPKIFQGGAKL